MNQRDPRKISRQDVGSWLEGPGAAADGGASPGAYPGERLGLPRSGPGSIARLGPRVVALVIDWLACKLVALAFFHVAWAEAGARGFIPLAIFAVENLVLVTLAGSTLGHRICGLRVYAVGMRAVTLLQVVVRTLLLVLVVPAVIWDSDGRGLHDKVPNTLICRI